jgi:hypothetical protein
VIAPMRPHLSSVTLVAIDGTNNPQRTADSLADAARQVAFARVLLLSPQLPEAGLPDGIEWTAIPSLSLKGYNQYCLAELHRHVETSHCLTVQGDSRIVNAAAWDDGWLAHDYIGAPWPPGHSGTEYRVGNSGFCLRSRALLEATSTLPNDTIVWRGTRKETSRDDVITCVMFRRELEAQGLRFAPVDVAARFAFESPTPEAPTLAEQFGMHERRQKRTPRTPR